MGTPAFPVAAFSPGGTKAYGPARSTSTMTDVYGTNASNANNSVFTGFVGVGNSISEAGILAIAQAANAERVRRGGSNITIPTGYYTGRVSASKIAVIRTAVEINGPAATSAYMGTWSGYNSTNGYYPTGTSTQIIGYDGYYGAAIYGPVTTYALLPDPGTVTYPQAATNTGNYDYTALYNAGSRIRAVHINDLITLINNNRTQCTCNCNYCTCNCNYCTCNCNYACTCNCNYSDERVKTNIEYI